MSATATAKPQRFDSLRNWIAGNGSVSKEAAALPELEDGGKPATQGSRSSENASDVKKVAPHVGVETAPDNPEHGSADKPVPESGLMQTTVGKMPEVERAVKVVTEENEKVAALKLDSMDDLAAAIASLEKSASALGLIATATAAAGASSAARPAAQPAPAATNSPKSAAATSAPAAQPPQNNITPEQQQLVAAYAKFGADQAAFLGEFLRGQAETRQYLTKWAAEGGLEEAEESQPAAGGAPADQAAMAAPGGDAGAPPAPGGDPAAAAGGAGGAGGGTPSPEELASACAEMGVGPDELMQAAQIMQQMVSGGAGASVPPADKAAAEKEVQLMTKLASETKDFVRSGKFRLKPAADGTPERARREVARSYVDEMLRFAGK